MSKSFTYQPIKQLTLVKLKLNHEGWTSLSLGIGISPTLQALQLNLCYINH